jgi:DNA-binding MarR family transcriptional regulator
MTPVQRDMYLLLDEFWKRFGCGPTYRELSQLRGTTLGNTKRIVDRLVKLGVVKRVANMDRSVRPSYMAFKRGEFE